MWMCLIMLDPRAFTSNKQVGLENEHPESTRGEKMYQFSLSKNPKPISFGASIVLRTILLPGKLALFTLKIEFEKVDCPGPKPPTDVEYHNTCNIYQIYNLNISDCR